jgi:hypothetical protein
MKTKSWLAYLVAVCVVLSGGMVARSQTAAKEHKVLFAVTSADPADWGMTMGNIRNLREGLKPDTVQVEVVAYGPGIAMLKKDSTVAAGSRRRCVPGLRECDAAPSVDAGGHARGCGQHPCGHRRGGAQAGTGLGLH